MATWGHSLINYDHLDTSDDLPELLDAIQDLGRLMELVLIGIEHSDAVDDGGALLFSILWPLQGAAHRAAKLEREQRAAPEGEPPSGPLHVVREGGA